MKTLACGDMGLTCPFVAKGDTEENVLQQLRDHGDAMHPEEVKVMKAKMSKEEMDSVMRSKIKEE
jgi:predicted small metal-binding protein